MSEEAVEPMKEPLAPGPVELHHEHESSYVVKFWQNGEPAGVAAQLIFTAGYEWPEVRFYDLSGNCYTVSAVMPQVLVRLGEICKARLEPVEPQMPMVCPTCGGRVIEYEPESVICVECGSKTDSYEAMKAAEPEPPKEREGA